MATCGAQPEFEEIGMSYSIVIHSTIPVPNSLQAPRKLILPSIFDTSFILDDGKLAMLSTNERM